MPMPIDIVITIPIIGAMTYQDLIAHFKTQTAAAKAAGVRQSSVALWKKRGAIPILRQAQIQLLTGGQLKADN